jgi:tRNA A-37 threonylcarbamoyl transferase component Bud32
MEALRRSSGVSPQVLLRDEPDDVSPIVNVQNSEEPVPDVVRGRYQMLGEIARGGMGVVLKGRDPDIGRDVALKVLRPEHASSATMMQRFIEEAQIGGQLQHPGILPVYEFGVDSQFRPYFTMRLVHGRSLATLLEERPRLDHDRDRHISIFQQVCQTIAYAHARGVIHRDLKPSNIMVGAFGEVQVVDWGLAKVVSNGRERSESLHDTLAMLEEPQVSTLRMTGTDSQSVAGSVFGTPAYMSPEQASGDVSAVDEQTDVFSLGAILCEILTGQPPYTGNRTQLIEQAASARLDEALARLDASAAEPELIELTKRCLEPSREHRLRHAGVLALEITSYLASVRERARAAELAAAEARATAVAERKSKRRILILAVALAVAIATIGIFAVNTERVHRVRAEQSIAEFSAMNRKANWFRGEASRIPFEQLERWGNALEHVRKTAEIMGKGAVDEETRLGIERMIEDLMAEEQYVRKRIRQGPGSDEAGAAH